MLRAVKIRLYPNKEQAIQYNKLLGCYRVVYNQCLNRKIESYKNDRITENLSTLGQFVHHELLKDDNFIWLREQNTKVLKQAVKDMLSAYKNFFEQHSGFPKFKCNKKYAEYLEKHKNCIRQATLKRLPCGEYYLSILVDGDLMHQVKDTDAGVGIDLGIKDFVITSDGEVFNNLHFKKSETKKIKRLQRQLSKKEKGSNNRNKVRIKLAKLYKKINDKKQYYLHAISNSLIDENQIICMEDLNVKGMVKNHNLAESICEMNFGEFRRMLEYKAQWYNRKIVFVDRFYPSSKTCHNCGYINKSLTLNDRQWVCPQCGEVIERDYNAALNILDEGLRIIGSSTTEFTLVDYTTAERRTTRKCWAMDDRLSNEALKSSGRLKQEVNNEQISLFKF